MAVNKVQLSNGTTLIDLTGDTISAGDALVGVSLHLATGESTVGTLTDFSGATSSAAGTHGLVPAPAAGDQEKFLRGDGTWAAESTYTLPTASLSVKGGVKVGNGLEMNGEVLKISDASTPSRQTLSINIPAAGSNWTKDSTSGISTYSVTSGFSLYRVDELTVEVDLSAFTNALDAQNALESWASIGRISYDEQRWEVTVYCYGDPPATIVPVKLTGRYMPYSLDL